MSLKSLFTNLYTHAPHKKTALRLNNSNLEEEGRITLYYNIKFGERLQRKGYMKGGRGEERRGYHLPLVVLLNNRRVSGVDSSSYLAIECGREGKGKRSCSLTMIERQMLRVGPSRSNWAW